MTGKMAIQAIFIADKIAYLLTLQMICKQKNREGEGFAKNQIFLSLSFIFFSLSFLSPLLREG